MSKARLGPDNDGRSLEPSRPSSRERAKARAKEKARESEGEKEREGNRLSRILPSVAEELSRLVLPRRASYTLTRSREPRSPFSSTRIPPLLDSTPSAPSPLFSVSPLLRSHPSHLRFLLFLLVLKGFTAHDRSFPYLAFSFFPSFFFFLFLQGTLECK